MERNNQSEELDIKHSAKEIQEAERVLLISMYKFHTMQTSEISKRISEMIEAKPEYERLYLEAHIILQDVKIHSQKLNSLRRLQQIKNWFMAKYRNHLLSFISASQHEEILAQKKENEKV